MANNPTPWFQWWASEFLEDPKCLSMTLEEKGAFIHLLSLAWLNPVRRGHLMLDRKSPLTDDVLAKCLSLDLEKFLQIKSRLVNEVKIFRIGSSGELYSRRQSNFKTHFELYGRQKHSKINQKSKIPQRKRTIESESESYKEKDLSSENQKADSRRDSSPLPEKKSKPKYTEVDLGLVQHLARGIKENCEKEIITERQIQDWANEMRLMREIDGRKENEIEALIDFVHGNRELRVERENFWYRNIRSGRSLRAKFSRLWEELKQARMKELEEEKHGR